MGLYDNNFAEVFSKLITKSGVSCYRIYQFTHLDQAYLGRLKTGERKNPSPETIVKIGLAFCHFNDKIKISEIEVLFKSVGRSLRITD